MRSLWIFAAALSIAGCECSDGCDEVLCGPCPFALSLDVVVPGGAVPTISGTLELSCETAESMTYCYASDAEPGDYTYTISAEGRAPQTVTLTVGPGGTGCCACEVEGAYARVQFEILDGGGADDGGSLDGGSTDAGADGGSVDGGTCNPDRVQFPMGGELSPGTLCDDVFVCVPDAEAAAAVTSASSSFDCTIAGPGSPCDGGSVRCQYVGQGGGGPSTLDEAEIADICAVTLLEPAPEAILCRVYL